MQPQKPGAATPEHLRPSSSKIGGVLVDLGSIDPADLAIALQEQERGNRRRAGEILASLGFCRPEDVSVAQQILEARVQHAGVETVRVGVDLLDMLMNLVGELVLARNQLLQASNSLQDAPLQSVSQRMNLIVTEVQQQAVQTRMQPIGNVWNKFPRTVRDLALSCGKEVQLEMHGQDTELDRTIIEAIKDPLTHLVRNAVDHGIEAPDICRSAGKDPTGRLTLRAFHEGGPVKIEIQDDGAGLNVDRLLKKAIERGLIQEHQAKTMAERDIFNLIFLLGFSTTLKVTKVSGRGVGDGRRKNERRKIGGAIDLQSSPGVGRDISHKITTIQTDTHGAVEAIGTNTSVINQVNKISGTIVTAVEEQSATTHEMIRNVADAAKGFGEITSNIAGVAEAAQGTSNRAQESQKAADGLAQMAAQHRSLVDQFKIAGTVSFVEKQSGSSRPKSMAANA